MKEEKKYRSGGKEGMFKQPGYNFLKIQPDSRMPYQEDLHTYTG